MYAIIHLREKKQLEVLAADVTFSLEQLDAAVMD